MTAISSFNTLILLASISIMAVGCTTSSTIEPETAGSSTSDQSGTATSSIGSEELIEAAPSTSEVAQVQPAISSAKIIGRALDNTLTIFALDSDGEMIAQGSGFFMPGGHVVTNAHVVTGATRVRIENLIGQTLGIRSSAIAVDVEMDVAVLSAPASSTVLGLTLSNSDPSVGDDIWVFGSPLGLQGSTSSGIVSARRDVEDQDLIQITAPISSGSSGGPVINTSGEVIGIATAMLTGGQNLNFAVPIANLQSFDLRSEQSVPFPSATSNESEAYELVDGIFDELTNLETVLIGSWQTGELTRYQYLLADEPAKMYQFQGNAGDTIEINARSTDFDTVASFQHLGSTEEEDWFIEDDDGGSGTNSKLTATLPHTGVYYITVRSYHQDLGSFTLQIVDRPAAPLRETTDDRWRYVGRSINGDDWFVDAESLRRNSAIVTSWRKIEFSTIQTTSNGPRYDVSQAIEEYDCNRRQNRLLAYTDYFRGTNVYSNQIPTYNQEWSYVVPGSMAEAIYAIVCIE